MKPIRQMFWGSLAALIAGAAVHAGPLSSGPVSFSIAQQPLQDALTQFGRQTGYQLLFLADITAEVIAPQVVGKFTPKSALGQLLANSGLQYRFVNERTIAIQSQGSESSQMKSSLLLPGETRGDETQNGMRLAWSGAEEQSSTESSEGSKLDEVVVQGAKRKFAPTDSNAATKIPMDVIDIPQALSVVSSELMSIVGVRNISSAVALAPSEVNAESDMPEFATVVSRGFQINTFAGYKYNGMAYQNWGAPIDIGVVDRIDVVRGPASVIYGESDYGATINVQQKLPETASAFRGEIGTSVDGGWRGLADITGALREDGTVSGRVIAIRDDYKPPQQLAFMRTTTIAPSVSWKLADNTTLSATFFDARREIRRSAGWGMMLDPETNRISLPDVPGDLFVGAAFNRNSQTARFTTARLDHVFSDGWKLSLSGAYLTSTNDRVVSYAGYIAPSGDTPLRVVANYYASSDYNAEVALTRDFVAFGRPQTVMINGSWRDTTYDVFYCLNRPLGVFNIYNPTPYAYDLPSWNIADPERSPDADYGCRDHQKSKEIGISGLALLHPSDRVSVMAGVRWSNYKSDYEDYWTHAQYRPSYEKPAVVPRLGVVYEVLPRINLYGSYSQGVIFTAARTASGAALSPETGVQWEVGAKGAVLNRRLTLAANVFQIDRKNVAAPDPDFPTMPFSIAIDGQRHRGFEVEAIGEPMRGFNLLASYSWLDVVIRKAPDPGMIGQTPQNTPKNMAKLYSTYQLLNGSLKGVSLGGGVFYIGKRGVDSFGTLRLPAYARVDLRIGYDALENMSFSCNVINVTNEKIYAAMGATAGLFNDYQSRRAVLLQMNFKY